MIIKLNPTACNKTSEISVSGEMITYDGEVTDFSTLLDGSQVQAEAPAIGIIKRVNGVVEITLQYFYDSENCTYADRFPELINIVNGIVKPITGAKNV